MAKMNYTDEELIRRVCDVEDIRDMMSKRSLYIAMGMRREELRDFWVNQPENINTASFGTNWGWYVGMQNIADYYVVSFNEKLKKQLAAAHRADPTIEETEENLGIGYFEGYPVSTPLIELAEDGKTAQGMWYSMGQRTTLNEDGQTACALWVYGRICVDFVKENGEWKIWHLLHINDIDGEVGTEFAALPVFPEKGSDPVEAEFGTPTIAMLTHDRTLNWADGYPKQPKPYYSFYKEMSYGPEGFKKFVPGGIE